MRIIDPLQASRYRGPGRRVGVEENPSEAPLGWYYWISDDGAVGPFSTEAMAMAHARLAGHSPGRLWS
jgi:hypothetical protein